MRQTPTNARERRAGIVHGRQRCKSIVYRVKNRIYKALGPFFPSEDFLRAWTLFDPKRGFETWTLEPAKLKIKGRPVQGFRTARTKAGFFESLYQELPRSVQRRFLALADEKSRPTANELRKLEREITAYARGKLIRELVTPILKLPPLPGRNGGRPPAIDTHERQRICKQVSQLTKSGDEGEPMSKREAVHRVAEQRGISERHIWRILRRVNLRRRARSCC